MGISTHILDTALGRPAAGVAVSLAHLQLERWSVCAEGATDMDGRCSQLLPESIALQAGIYRIHYKTAEYYRTQGVTGLYPYVEIAFEVRDPHQHYHIPLLLTANGYTTYRGS